MGIKGIELISLLMVFLVFFLDKTGNYLTGYLRVPKPSKTLRHDYKAYLNETVKLHIQIMSGILLELAILLVYGNSIYYIITRSSFSLVEPDPICSLSLMIYICVIGLSVYSVSMLLALRNRSK